MLNYKSEWGPFYEKLIEMLRANKILADLTDEQITQLALRAQFEERKAGEVLIKKGDPGDKLYFILAGQVRLIDEVDGKKRLGAYLFEGDFCGEFALLTDEPHPATEDIPVDTILAVFDRPTFDWLLSIAPDIANKLKGLETFYDGQNLTEFRGRRHNEAIIAKVNRNFLAYIAKLPGPLLLIILGTLIGILLASLGWSGYILSGCFVSLGILIAVYLYLDWINDDFIVTSERVIHTERILLHGETREEAPLTSIQDVSVETPNLFANIFDYSDVYIKTAGAGTIIFDGMKDGDALRDEIFKQRRKAQERVEASDVSAVRRSLKERMGWDVGPGDGTSLESTSEVITHQPAVRLPGFLDYYIPRVKEVKGEVITWRKNYFVFLKLVTAPLIAGLFLFYFMFAAFFGFFPFGQDNPMLALYLLIGWLVTLLWYTYQYDAWRKDEYHVTRSTIIDYKGSAFNLRGEQRRQGTFDVIQNSTYVTPNFLAKLLNIGHVIIETAGTELTFTFEWVYNPRDVQQEIFKRWRAYKESQTQQAREYEEKRYIRWLGEFHDMFLASGEIDTGSQGEKTSESN
jgi:CRP-like cAMP-binding protein